MNETGWQAIGRIAKARRERLGLRQDELAEYGGPKVATVGKFERAAQESFPLRTQHQMEKALGWSRTIVEQVVGSIEQGDMTADEWEYDLVHEDIPDMGRRRESSEDRTLDEAVASLRAVLRLVPEEVIDAATRSALHAIVPFTHPGRGVGDVGEADVKGASAPTFRPSRNAEDFELVGDDTPTILEDEAERPSEP